MKTLVGGFHSRRFSRRDLDSSLRGRRISHKKRKSRRKGRRFYGKKSRRKMVGGVPGNLRIIVEYNKDATTEEDIRFKITRIEGGDNSGMGNRDGINLDYKNCEQTRNELINKLFGERIKPTGATMGMNNKISSTTTINTKKVLDDVQIFLKHPLTQNMIKKGTNIINEHIRNGNIGNLAADLLPLLGFNKTKESAIEKIIKKNLNSTTSNNSKVVSNPTNNPTNNLTNNLTNNPTKNLTNNSTIPISNEPMSEGFKESFMLAMALKMFDENDDAEIGVDEIGDGVGVMGNPVAVGKPDSIEEIPLTKKSKEAIELIKKIKEVSGQRGMGGEENTGESDKIMKKLEKIIPNTGNFDTTKKEIIDAVNYLINLQGLPLRDFNYSSLSNMTPQDLKQKEINEAIIKLNQILEKGNTTPLKINNNDYINNIKIDMEKIQKEIDLLKNENSVNNKDKIDILQNRYNQLYSAGRNRYL